MIRIAPEGWPFILAAWALALVFGLLGWQTLLLLWLPVALWVVAFYRDPARRPPEDEALLVAPADGRVVSIVPMEEQSFLGGPATRVAIFMNVFNVHVNRYPADGTVTHRSYTRGAFRNAATEKASSENEQCSLGLETHRGKILVRQIAGLVARRIVTDHQPGARVFRGERLGLIRFGSRVDVFLPPEVEVLVTVGETTRAGETPIGAWR